MLCSLIEVDCGIISLIKFFHFLRLFLSNEGGGATPFLSSVLWRFTSPPSLLIIVSITHPSSVSLFLPRRCSSSFLLSHPKLFYTLLLALFFRSLWPPEVRGKDFRRAIPASLHLSPLSSLSVIRISQMFRDYFYLDSMIPPTHPPPQLRGKGSAFSVFRNQDRVGEYFCSKDKAALISLFALFP